MLGALIGGAIGDTMDGVDRGCMGQVLEHAPPQQTVSWHNPDENADYAITPTDTYQTEAAVDLRVAIYATAVEDPSIGNSTGREVASREQIVGVAETSALVVALVAEKRSGRNEKSLVVRPVRVVAREAVFDHRGVLPEKRPALFGVTLVTELIDAIGAQKRVRS